VLLLSCISGWFLPCLGSPGVVVVCLKTENESCEWVSQHQTRQQCVWSWILCVIISVPYCCYILMTFFGQHYSSKTTWNNVLKIGRNTHHTMKSVPTNS
jgi:hypothetical protein